MSDLRTNPTQISSETKDEAVQAENSEKFTESTNQQTFKTYSLASASPVTAAAYSALSDSGISAYAATSAGDSNSSQKINNTIYGTKAVQVLNFGYNSDSYGPCVLQGGTDFVVNLGTNSTSSHATSVSLTNDYYNMSYTSDNGDVTVNGVSVALGAALCLKDSSFSVSNSFVNNTIQSNSGTPYGGAIGASNANLYVSSSNFINNRSIKRDQQGRSAGGGAIYAVNSTYVTINNSNFLGNRSIYTGTQTSSSSGGAIKAMLDSTISVTGSYFRANLAYGEPYNAQGGAIDSEHGELVVSYTTFYDNIAVSASSSHKATGGAIHVYSGFADIESSSFLSNTAEAMNASAWGGAINLDDYTGISYVKNSEFSNNIATGQYGYGGAISATSNTGTASLNILSSIFNGNSATSNGGALHLNTTASIDDSTFSGNKAFSGGAIYNLGSLEISNSSFSGNESTGNGGAIYNSGTLTFSADTTFSGNKDVYGSNDIYNSGTINVSSKVVLNSGYKSAGVNDVEYVNILAGGQLVIANPYSQYTKTRFNLELGELHFSAPVTTNGRIYEMAFRGGRLNLQNGGIDTLAVDCGVLVSDSNLSIDADLANSVSDEIIFGEKQGNTSPHVTVDNIHILSDGKEKETTTTLINSIFAPYMQLSNTINITYASAVENTYVITYDNTTGLLTFTNDSNSLKKTVNDTSPLTRIYDMAENEEVEESIGSMGGGYGAVVTVNGNGNAVNANGNSGVVVNSGQTLNINNVSSWNGAVMHDSGNVVDLKDGGTLNITNSKFTNNKSYDAASDSPSAGVIAGYNCNVTISDSSFENNYAESLGGAIYIGTLTGSSSNQSTLTVTNTSFSSNSGTYAVGVSNSTSSFTDCLFSGNTEGDLAIFNGTTTITAQNKDVSFNHTGNHENIGIYLVNSNVNQKIYFKGSRDIYLNQGIMYYHPSTAASSSVAIYKQDGGTLHLNARYSNNPQTISAYDGNVYIEGGKILFTRTSSDYDGYFGGTTSISSGAALEYNSSVNDTLPCTITGSGSFIKSGAGTLTISGNNSGFSGIATINGGKILYNGSSYFSGLTNVNGNTLEFNLSNNQSYGNFITGSGSFIKSGSGGLSISGDNSGFSGSTTINGGSITFNKTSANDKYFGGSTNINGNSLIFNLTANESIANNKFTGSGSFTKNGSGTLTLSGVNNGFTGTTTIGGGTIQYNSSSGSSYFGGTTNVNGNSLIFNLSTNESYSGKFYGAGNFYKQGTGTLTLTGNNSGFTGTTTIQGGIIQYNSSSGSSYLGGQTNVNGYSLIFNLSTNESISNNKFYGSGNFYKQGNGTLTLSGTNNGFTGTTTIQGGTIQYNSSNGSSYFGGRTNVNGNNLIFNLATNETHSNKFYGSGNFYKQGTGTLTLTGDNSGFTGTTTIQGGTIQYNSSTGSSYLGGRTNVNGNTLIFNLATNESHSNKFYGSGNFYKQGTGTLTLTGNNSGFTGTTTIQGGTIQYNSSSGSSYLGGTTNVNGYNLIFNLSTNESYSGKFYGAGNFYKQGTGTLTLTGNNSGFTGTTTIQGGTIQYNSSTGSSYLGGRTNVNGNTLIFNLATNETHSNKFYGSGSFIKQGTGTLTLTGDNSGFTGTTTIQGGTIQYNSSTGSSYLGGRTNVNGNTLIFNLATNETHSNKFYGSGSFIKQGTGTLTLTGNNSAFTGTTTIQDGTVYFDKNSSSDAFLGGKIVNNATLTYDLAANDTISGTLSGSGTFNKTGGATLTLNGNNSGFTGTTNINQGAITFTRTGTDQYFGGTTNIYGTLNFDIKTDYTLSGKFAQNGTFNKYGSGTLTITGDNSAFSGTTNISEGSLLFIKDTAANKYFSGNTILNGGTLEYRVNAAETIAGKVSGTGNIIKSGTSTLTITSNNSGFTGTTYVNSGRLIYSRSSANDLYFGGATNIAAGGILEFNLSNDLNFSNTITGTGIFNKTGSATLTLSGNHGGFTGTTIIDAGKIIHRKNSASDVYFGGTTTINNGGTLEYALATGETLTGTINGGGNFIKSGTGALTMSGNNGGFTGTTTISGGSITFNKNNTTDRYFGGSTIINAGTTLNYNTLIDDTLPSRISGRGTFNKTGTANLQISGDQSGFSGTANINAGKITFNKTTTTDKYFSGTTQIAANSTLEYVTAVNDTLAGKLTGSGIFNKKGAATLNMSGDNRNFTGTTIIDAGSILFSKNSTSDYYFGGKTTINSAGILEFNLAQNENFSAILNGNGTFKKTGNATLTIGGDNSAFSGKTVIDGGKIVFEKTGTTKYFGGTTTINAGGELQYITTQNDTIAGTITGNGTLRKDGNATLTFSGNNSGFTGTTYLDGGITAFEKTASNSWLGGKTVIGNNATLNYTTTLDDTINGTIEGTGKFNKSGNATLLMSGNNSAFSGTAEILNGKVAFTNNNTSDAYFGGNTIVNANTTLEFVNNADGELEANLSGSGTFNKKGAQTLEILGNQSNFTGIVNITEGKMSFTTAADKSFFSASEINISGANNTSSLDYTYTNSGIFDRLVNLKGNAQIDLNAASNSSVTLNNLITTTGNNNITNFNNGTFVFQTDYNSYGATGTGNKLTFTDTTAKLDTTIKGFGSTNLNAEFSNSTLDMRNDNGTANAHGIGDAVFNKLTLTGNNTLYVDMDLKNHPDQHDPSGEKPQSDRLVIGAGSSGEIDLKGIAVTVDGRWAYEEVQIIDGEGVTIKDFAPYLTATSTNYIYEITKSDKNGYVIVSTVDYEDDPTKNPETLKVMHQSVSNRAFSVNANNPHYMVLSNLGKMGTGEFYVSGISNTTSIIDANNLWSLFNADSTDGENRELELSSLNVQNAVINVLSGRLNGSALYLNGEKSLVKTNTTVFNNNSAFSGGAIYNNGGELTLLTTELTNNSARIDGGAVYLNEGKSKIENSTLVNNTASSNAGAVYNKSSDAEITSSLLSANSAKNGGAVYNENELSITDTRFDGNSATASGGAVYNAGTLNIIASETGKTLFYNNKAAHGGDIYNDNGIINFSGKGTTEIESGIAGNGQINKIDSGTLTLRGENNDFEGKVQINDGKILFDKLTKDDSYLGGDTEIAENGTLEYNLTTEENHVGTNKISGTGVFKKTGDANFNVSGQNDAFKGEFNIQKGAVNYSQSTDGTYFGGNTSINALAVLNYTNSAEDNIKELSGAGTFNKNGIGTAILTGNNNGFIGITNLNEGTLKYTKTKTEEHFIKGKINVAENTTLELNLNKAETIGANIYGTGIIRKTGADIWTLGGNNSGFTGKTVIDEGRVDFEKTADTVYLGGTTTINENGTLKYITTENDVIEGTINGSGNFLKTGTATLTLSGKNDVFSGHTTIDAGKIDYQQSYGGSYFASSNEIRSGATLDFTNYLTDNINTLSSSGTLNKYGSGTLNLTKNNADFTGIINLNEGKITYNKTTDEDKFITGTFNVNENTELNLNIETEDTLDATIKGTGVITKTGSSTLTVSGKNKDFTGLFDIKTEKVIYNQSENGSYFGGATNINYGTTLVFKNSTDDYIKDVKSSGTINLNNPAQTVYGSFVKEGTGTLYLSGDNSEYTGTVTINEGTLVYDDLNNKFFASQEIDIEGIKNSVAKLEYTKNDEKAVWDTHVNLSGNANLTVKGTGNGQNTIIVNQPPKTSGNNNETVFTEGTFEFNNSFKEYGNNSTNTKITFDDMTFELSDAINDFGQSNLNSVFNNSVINTKNDKLDTLTFGDLTLTGTNTWHIDLDLKNNPDQHLPGPDPEADKIIAETGSGVITLGAIKIIEDGRWKLKEIQLVDAGNVIIADFAKYTQFTSNGYEYDISKSENNEGSIIISTTDYNPGEETLKKAHKFEGDRGFNVNNSASTTENGIYVVLSNLETMGAGRFDVSGLDKTQNTITGNHEWALFNADSTDGKDRILNIYDLTISDAITDVNCGRKDGAAVYLKGEQSSANIQNTIFNNNKSDEKGGAIYNENATATLTNVNFNENSAKNGGALGNSGKTDIAGAAFDKNTAANDAGAILNSGEMTIENAVFTENTAQNNGGAIHNSKNLTLTDVNFKNNMAITGKGGAIYNSGTITINATENRLVEFENNTANAEGSDIHNENGIINFAGKGAVSIKSGITGNGEINKNESGTLLLGGKNHNYTGQTNINDGILYFEKTTDTTYLGGTTTINENGTLIYETTENDTINGTVNGNGTLKKYGTNTLTLSGDNSDFTGHAHLFEGSTSFTKTETSSYLGGKTTIHENAQLEYITNIDDTVNGTIDGNGYIKKSGDATLIFTGDNSNFTGLTTIDAGKLLFDKNSESDIQLAGNTLVNSGGTLEFDLEVDDIINGTVFGEGNFIKSGDATLTLTGNNSGFEGTTTIKTGTIAFEKTTSNTYLGGNTIIEKDGTLEYKTTQNDLVNGTISGSGTIQKYGENTLIFSGDNSRFTGQTNIHEGTIYFEKNENTAYLGGKTTINENGTLIYNTTTADTINGTVNGSGTFIKTGDDTLTLTGTNNAFSGAAYIEKGTVKYEQSTNGSYISGSTYIANTAKLELNNQQNDKLQNISGLGIINKNGDGTFVLDGVNKDFWGTLNINKGEISYQQSENGSYINGLTNIEESGSLRINISNDESLTYFTGKGSIIKEGTATAIITGNNSSFTGTTTIDAGKILFNRKYANDEYFHDKTTINESGELHFNLEANYLLNSKLYGTGQFTKTGSGTLYLNGWNQNFKGTVNLNEGAITLLAGASMFAMDKFNMSANTFFDTRNGILDNINVHNITVSGDRANLGIDIDINNQKGDYFSADSFSGEGKLVIDHISIIDDAFRNSNTINIINPKNNFAQNVMLDPALSTLEGKIYRYDTSYNPATGNLTLTSAGGNNYKSFSPSILSSNIGALVGGYLMQLNSYDEAFANMDMLMLMPRAQREAIFLKNKIAANDAIIAFSPALIPEENKGAWYRTSTAMEKVPLKNGPKVNNIMYNSYFGIDSPIKTLKHGISATYTAYAGYTGSHQTYDGVSLYQNGITAGTTAAFYYNNFFSAITANGGAIMTDASGIWGTDHPFMVTAGIASKSGYNWETLDGRVIIQPNLQVSYTFVNLFEYTNKAGVNLQTKPLNSLQIIPGIKIIANLPSGWMPYMGVNVITNIMNETNFKANDVMLPEMSVRPFVSYGVGVQKRWGERFTGFVQTMIRSGGREGLSFSFGLRWSI